MTGRRYAGTWAAAMAALVASVAAQAADTEATLGNVVVSAAKVEQSTAEAPANVSVVTAREIEDSGAVRLGDVLTAQAPSVYLRGGGVGNTSRDASSTIISIRGGALARSKVIVDGVSSLGDANSGNLNLSTLGLGDVERIEVVPGVSSALYGSDAIGGVINIITKAPRKREINARAARGFGDGDRNLVEASYRDRYANGLGLSLSAYRQDMDGYAKNDLITATPTACGACTTPVSGWERTTTNTGATTYIIGDKGAVSSRSESVNGTLFFDLSPAAKLRAGASRYVSRSGYEHYHLYLTTPTGPVTLPATDLEMDGRRVARLAEMSYWLGSNPSRKEESRYFAGYEGRLGADYLLKLDAAYVDRDAYYVQPSTSGATYTGGPGTGTLTPNTAKDLLAQVSFPIGARHFLVAGAGVNATSLHRQVHALANWRDIGSKTALNDEGDGNSRTDSLFVQDQIALAEAWTLYAGGRYDRWSTHGYVAKHVGGVTPPTTLPERSESALSPKLALVWRASEVATVKGSVGTAFRAPTLYDMYAADTVSGSKLITSDARLKPEKARAWDIGTEFNWPGGANLKAAWYETKLSDMIYSQETPYTGPYTATIPTTVTILSEKTNAATGRMKGLELSGELPLSRGLKASASYTYTDARVTDDRTNTGMQGKRMVFVPKNMASLALDGQRGAWAGHFSARYSGLQYSTTTNADVVKDVFSGVSKYWIADLKVSYRIDRQLKLSLLVNNLFDRTYYEYYLMPGRNAAIELSASF